MAVPGQPALAGGPGGDPAIYKKRDVDLRVKPGDDEVVVRM